MHIHVIYCCDNGIGKESIEIKKHNFVGWNSVLKALHVLHLGTSPYFHSIADALDK